MAWSGVLAVAGLVALVAGGMKVLRPDAVVTALRGVGLRFVSPGLVRAGSVIEASLGAVAVTSGWPAAMLALGLTYLALAGFVAVARSNPRIKSCGCFGESDTPPAWRHVVVDVGLATACVGAAVAGSPGIGAVVRHQPALGIPYVAVGLVATWLIYVVLSGPGATELAWTKIEASG